jgi:type II restriction enzyme
MIFLEFYKNKLKCNTSDEVFDYFIKNLQGSISDWGFFVGWDKIKENIAKIETELNILNSLLGKKEDLEQKFMEIILEYPKVRKALPILIAIREQKLKKMPVMNFHDGLNCEAKHYIFDTKIPITKDIQKELLRFFKESGLQNVFEDRNIKNLVDYCFGVEVGMDTNARKNRGGDNMEAIVEVFIKDLCLIHNYTYLTQANAEKIKKVWNIDVPVDRSSRRYDFVINNGKRLIIFETNFYNGGGSKLKSTAGEFRDLFNVLDGRYTFIWVTDGIGWKSVHRPLRETFDHNDYIFNLDMLNKGVLNDLVM